MEIWGDCGDSNAFDDDDDDDSDKDDKPLPELTPHGDLP